LGSLGSLILEPGFLSSVSEAVLDPTDHEMRPIVRRARGSHASFFVASWHGVDLVFRRSSQGDLVVIPRGCR